MGQRLPALLFVILAILAILAILVVLIITVAIAFLIVLADSTPVFACLAAGPLSGVHSLARIVKVHILAGVNRVIHATGLVRVRGVIGVGEG